MKIFVRLILGLLAAAIATYLVATALNSQFVIAGHNVPVSLGDRLNMTMFDISNMLLYMAVILIALIIGFIIAAGVKKLLPHLARFAYPIAGAAAMGMVLGLMYLQFQTIPISGARSTLGFLSQMLAGGFGGWVFAKFVAQPKTSHKQVYTTQIKPL